MRCPDPMLTSEPSPALPSSCIRRDQSPPDPGTRSEEQKRPVAHKTLLSDSGSNPASHRRSDVPICCNGDDDSARRAKVPWPASEMIKVDANARGGAAAAAAAPPPPAPPPAHPPPAHAPPHAPLPPAPPPPAPPPPLAHSASDPVPTTAAAATAAAGEMASHRPSPSPGQLRLPMACGISPAQLAYSAMLYLPMPIIVLNSLKTVVLANEAMGRMLGMSTGPEVGATGGGALERLRGQSLAQVGIDMLQDGRPVWVAWETFLDSLVQDIEDDENGEEGGPEDGKRRGGSLLFAQDSAVDVVICSSGAVGDGRGTDSRQVFARMMVSTWEVEVEEGEVAAGQTYFFTLTFIRPQSDGGGGGRGGGGGGGSVSTRRAVARSGVLEAADKKTIVLPAGSNPPSSSAGSSRSSNISPTARMTTAATATPPSSLLSPSPFPPPGPPPSSASASSSSTPSILQKLIRMKDALLDTMTTPIVVMWRDGSVGFPNRAARELLRPGVEEEAQDADARGLDLLLPNWEVWTEDFSRRLSTDEHPLAVLLRTGTPFPSQRVGMVDRTGRRLVYDVLGEAIRDTSTAEFVAGVVTCRDITVIKQEISQIREKDEERFRLICDTMPQLVWTARSDGRLDFFNTRWYSYTGLTAAQSMGERDEWARAFHPDDAAGALAKWHRSLETGEPFVTEYRCRRHDGEWRWHLGRALPQRNRQTSKIEKWFGTCTDVHESIGTKLLATQTRHQLRSVLAHSHVTVFTVDTQRRITMLEGALIWDAAGENGNGNNTNDSNANENKNNMASTNSDDNNNKNNTSMTTTTTNPTTTDKNNRDKTCIATTTTTTTATTTATTTNSDNNNGSSSLSFIGENMYNTFNRLDPQLPAGQRPVFLQPVDDVLAGRVTGGIKEHKMNNRWYRTRFHPIWASSSPTPTSTSSPSSSSPPSAPLASSSSSAAAAIISAKGKPPTDSTSGGGGGDAGDADGDGTNGGNIQLGPIEGAIGVIMDVTELKLREAAIEEQSKAKQQAMANEAAAKEANRLKSQFLANMSHEIRTPITGVLGMAELLADKPLEPEAREYVDIISRSANALLTVINDILDFSKIESGRLEIEEVPFEFAIVVNDVAGILRFAALRKNLDFESDISDSIGRDLVLVGDPGRVQQIITNLLTNSIKFTNQGHVRFSVAVERESDDTVEIRFVVEDTGIGIEEEVRQRLFQPFSQGDASTARRFGGTGLGLTICKNLIDLMRGRIILESTVGRGTTTTFWIPFRKPKRASRRRGGGGGGGQQPDSEAVVKVSSLPPRLQSEIGSSVSCGSTADRDREYDTADAEPKHERKQVLSREDRAKIHVLVVEDNHINQRIAIESIRSLGFAVSAVWNGQEVLDYLHLAREGSNRKPDIILMDVQMPVIDGYKCTHLLRHHVPYRAYVEDVPIVAMTASAIQGDRERCTRAGMDDYMAKPVKKLMLEQMLVRWSRSRRRHRIAAAAAAAAAMTAGGLGGDCCSDACSEAGGDQCGAVDGEREEQQDNAQTPIGVPLLRMGEPSEETPTRASDLDPLGSAFVAASTGPTRTMRRPSVLVRRALTEENVGRLEMEAGRRQ